MSHGKHNASADIIANRKWEREIEREAAERKRRRDAFLRQRDEEYARLFPRVRYGHFTPHPTCLH